MKILGKIDESKDIVNKEYVEETLENYQPLITSSKKLDYSLISGTPTLAAVATSGSYNDLNNKPTIPSAVTESTVSGWGFTKNTGTYSKPSGGIPKTDLENSVQTSLGKADTALQSHQDISGKQDKLVSGTNIKTINGESILGSGDIGTYIDPNRMIVYTSTNGSVVTPGSSSDFGANIISNTYKNGKGVILFDAPVTKIGNGAFSDSSLKSIIIPDCVTTIEEEAFYDNYDLENIKFPSNLTHIGERALTTNQLTEIIIPEGVTHIDASAFSDCTSSKKIVLPKSLISIGIYAFAWCFNSTEIYCKATTPPTAGLDIFYDNGDFKLYVPYDSVAAYKSASGWSTYADKIVGYHYDTGLLKTINGQSIVGEGDVEIRTINGQSIVGSGDITVGYKSVTTLLVTGTTASVPLLPNDCKKITNVLPGSLSITLTEATNSSILNEYFIEFTTGSSGNTISFPSTIKWANGEAPSFEADTTYQISIVNNLGVVTKFK